MSQPEAVDAAATAIAGLTPPTQHSQLCPVWTKPKKATVSECNCWILHNAIQEARVAVVVAAPILAKAERERLAQQIHDFAKEAAETDSPDAILGLFAARSIVRGHPFPLGELDELLARGDSGEGSGS